LQPVGDGYITLVRFVEKIPFTGQDWDLVEEREMLVWKPNDYVGSFTKGAGTARVRLEVALRQMVSRGLRKMESVLEGRWSRRSGRA